MSMMVELLSWKATPLGTVDDFPVESLNHSKLVFFNTILNLAVSFSFIVHLSLGTLNVTISGGCNDVTTIVAAAIIALCCS